MQFASRGALAGAVALLQSALVAVLCAACGGGSAPAQAPAISSQPVALLAATAGVPASLSVSATGSEPISYQWQRDGADIAGATGASYQLPSPRFADSGHKWRVVVRNGAGSVTSSEATLNVTGIALVAGSLSESGYVNGAGSAARFNSLYGLAFNSKGELFLADEYSYAIRKIAVDGTVSTVAGNGVSGKADGGLASAQFEGPVGLAFDASDNLFITDAEALTVRKLSAAGVVSTLASVPLGPNDGRSWRLYLPTGIAVDGGGNLYVTNGVGTRKISPQGVTTIVEGVDVPASGTFGTADLRWRGVSIDGAGNLSLVNLLGGVSVIPANGGLTPLAGSNTYGSSDGSGAAASFQLLTGTALDKSGNLYAVDSSAGTIRKITPAGVVSTVAGVVGAGDVQLGAFPGHLAGIRGIAVGPDGSLFVTTGSAVLQLRF